jgi:hypothetical protein
MVRDLESMEYGEKGGSPEEALGCPPLPIYRQRHRNGRARTAESVNFSGKKIAKERRKEGKMLWRTSHFLLSCLP